MRKNSHRLVMSLVLSLLPLSASSAVLCESLLLKIIPVAAPEIKQNWMSQANPQRIKGYVISGGQMLVKTPGFTRNGFAPNDFIITEAFFKRAQVSVPRGAVEINLSTYGYYNSKKNYQFYYGDSRLDRGGGRDHVLLPQNGFSGKIDNAITEKGSGLNETYSAVNGAFEIKNFRKNGLQEHTEVVSESVLIHQLNQMGVPIVEHPQVRLAPIEFQKLIGAVDEKGLVVGKLAAQSTRVQSKPRDSFNGVENVPKDERYKLVAAIVINNIGHGGINPENMAQGMLNDPGHVTVGYPIVSGIYRCVICAGAAGTRADGTMVGIMDYYFPKEEIKNYDDYFFRGDSPKTMSTHFKFDAEIGNGVFSAISQDLYQHNNLGKLSPDQLSSLEKVLRQKMTFNSYADNNLYFVSKVTAKLLKRGGDDTFPLGNGTDNEISARFLMQLGALKKIGGKEHETEVNSFINRFSTLLDPAVQKDYRNLIELFALAYEASPDKARVKRKLFNEYLTLNMVLSDTQAATNYGRSYKEVTSQLKKVLDEDAKPVVWDPMSWLKVVESTFTESYKGKY